MKIRIDKDIVTFTPEHAAEAVELEALWIKLGNCLGDNKSLEPLGVYMPSEDKSAVFHISGLNQEEKAAIRQRRAEESAAAAARMAEYREANMKRNPVEDIVAFTDIKNGYIEYDGQYFGAVLEIPAVEFRFFSEHRRQNSIENGLGRVLRTLNPNYSANIVKLERPIKYDDYLAREQEKLESLRHSYEQGFITEEEFLSKKRQLLDL